ncbi:juvenile hormone acid O-methyltransferase-like [Musca autumnalis]|uniref:juvenile hormone acid O-methyltransferase-like n=1 Tax=Musca autumnalis TaxID=221902 RepID=UPI003CF8F428
MNKPALYHKSHLDIKRDAGALLKHFSSKLQWRSDGGDTIIDIGTGPGDATIKSELMLDFFKSKYQLPERCGVRCLDIETNTLLPNDLVGRFDHLISSLVLHWVPDNRTALKNMFSLLRPEGGDCILVFFSFNTVFQANYILSCNPKWSQYIGDVNRWLAPLQFSDNPTTEFRDMMKEAGFSNICIDAKKATYRYRMDMDEFKESLIPVCGVYDSIPKCHQEEFLNDYAAASEAVAMERCGLSPDDAKCVVVADFIVAYGQKLPEEIPFK